MRLIVTIGLLLWLYTCYLIFTDESTLIPKEEEICKNGVVYYYFNTHGGSVTPKFLPDSKVETCK